MMALYTHYFDPSYTSPVKAIVLSPGGLRVICGENKPLIITEFDSHFFPYGSFHVVRSTCHQISNRSGSLQVRYSVLQHRRYCLAKLGLCFNFAFADSTERLGFERELQLFSLVGYWSKDTIWATLILILLGNPGTEKPEKDENVF
jgi:hypothetical protein